MCIVEVCLPTCFDLQSKSALHPMCKGTQYIQLVGSRCSQGPLHHICHPILEHDRLGLHFACCYLQQLPTAIDRDAVKLHNAGIVKQRIEPSTVYVKYLHSSCMTNGIHSLQVGWAHVLSPLGINSLQSSSTKRPPSALMKPPLACCARAVHRCRQSPSSAIDRQPTPTMPTQGVRR